MNGKTFDYDPMVYDTMRELANQLGGHYVHQSYEATTDAERERWRLVALDVSREAEAVDPYDEAAVRAKTADFTSRLRALQAA
ncbi:MAG: hypothetical protein BGO26_00040 [Actinobacteria bacterium 69-20]|jgi:hypothetical protein|nr:MAG: hypothetical protein BGO26_00040 [Actinobacteria bacterium 69-20]